MINIYKTDNILCLPVVMNCIFMRFLPTVIFDSSPPVSCLFTY